MSYLCTLLVTAPEAQSKQLLDIDGTLFIQLGIFVILLLVLNRVFWRPYLRIRVERATRMEGYRADAARLSADGAGRLARVEAALAEARRQASGERALARVEAQAREQTILAQAQAAGHARLAASRAELQVALKHEQAKLAARAEAIGLAATRKILGREVSP